MRLDYEGRFLARITEYGLYQAKSSDAVAVDLRFETISFLNGDGSPSDYAGYTVRGRVFVIGKEGDVLQGNVEDLSDATGWDGDLNSIVYRDWDPKSVVQVHVEKEVSNGRTYFNVARVRPENWRPAAAGNVSPNEAKAIAQRYTSALKSVIAKRRRQQSGEPPASTDRSASPPASGLPTSTPQNSDQLTPQAVWDLFCRKCDNAGITDKAEKWAEVLKSVADGKTLDQLSQEDLRKIAAANPEDFDDDIPF